MVTYLVDLGQGITLDMLHIPGGSFTMGSPEGELAFKDERPQHPVTVSPFWMGKYTITQAQWQVVAAMPQVERKLDLDPFHFKGSNRPVERVNWFDAMEFCARLSAHTQRTYTLPSEVQWEYACRAGTTTLFHFGDTITPDLANYNGNQTTEVGNFLPNDFGLYDMHGNVWEWCQDHFCDSYNGAPNDGSAWVDAKAEKDKACILRGGSWGNNPRDCRCAYRYDGNPDYRSNVVGFRVVSVPPRTLLG